MVTTSDISISTSSEFSSGAGRGFLLFSSHKEPPYATELEAGTISTSAYSSPVPAVEKPL